MAWSKTVPVTGSYIIDIPSIFGNNWNALESILGVEHYTFTNVLSGRHCPGILPVMGALATSAITAVSLPATGALYQDTTLGVHKVYNGSTWQQINLLPHSQVSVFPYSDYLVTAGTTAILPFNTEVFDTLNEYNTSSYTFIAKAAGFYCIHILGDFAPIGGIRINLQIAQYNASDQLINMITSSKYTISSDELTMRVIGFLSLAAGDKIKTYAWHNGSSSVVSYGSSLNLGSGGPILEIYRLS
jgi:hypothetical protein